MVVPSLLYKAVNISFEFLIKKYLAQIPPTLERPKFDILMFLFMLDDLI